jgi:hypothetical protein
MTPQQIVTMVARLFSIWLVVGVSRSLADAALMLSTDSLHGVLSIYLTTGTPLFFAGLLWFFPMLVADSSVPRSDDANAAAPMSAREATAVGCVIIGLWVSVTQLSFLVFVGSSSIFRGGPYSGFNVWGAALQCMAGAFLVFKPWLIANKIFPLGSTD